jgi:O-antigen ligase
MEGFTSQMESQILPTLNERIYYWQYYGKNILSSSEVFLFGHAQKPERAQFPSAHNYYLDLAYNFGTIALLPLLAALSYTLVLIYRKRSQIFGSSSLLGLTGVTIFLLIVDNSFKVGLRQPYSGIVTFFLWGVLLSRLFRLTPQNNSSYLDQSHRPK